MKNEEKVQKCLNQAVKMAREALAKNRQGRSEPNEESVAILAGYLIRSAYGSGCQDLMYSLEYPELSSGK